LLIFGDTIVLIISVESLMIGTLHNSDKIMDEFKTKIMDDDFALPRVKMNS